MNASGEFLKSMSPKTVFGLRICDLGWNSMLELAERLVMLPGTRSTIAFLDAGAAIRSLADPSHRRRLERSLILPSGGRAFNLAIRLLYGKAASARFSPETFVPALLTFLDRKCRVGIIGRDARRIEALRDHFARHAPWHEIVAILPDQAGRNRLDLIVVDEAGADEAAMEQMLSGAGTGVVVMTGKRLSTFVKPAPAPYPAANARPAAFAPPDGALTIRLP